MDIFKWTEKMMGMDEEEWKRHASPLSVYSRFTILPLLSLSIWSKEWIGFWSTLPIVISIAWVWLNPRVFSAPKNTNSWASVGTFGERIYLQRSKVKIPGHHLRMCNLLSTLSALGVPILIYGLYTLDVGIVVLGNVWVMAFKAWFVDRMVWLYMDLKDTDPEYASWLKL